ncbi:hypothetical protein [uncultured Brachyspira sp.]|uniref:hypothetical protein n=1 Tax=uncultured Brachyspira sp. TaxID=221953 RepID=UPI0025F7DA5D|nr:hypothetical protein [uncultured Brachyspira sp.]
MKKLYLLILIFSVFACSNPLMNPSGNNQNISSVRAVTFGKHNCLYGNKKEELNAADKDILKSKWTNFISLKDVYEYKNCYSKIGFFDTNGNYFDNNDTANPRTTITDCGIYEYNNKKYLAGIYWDNKAGTGMYARYRLIIIDEEGRELAFYGGGSEWIKYDFIFGYLKLN